MPSLNDPISKLHLVGPKQEQALNYLGVKTITDLLYYFPRDWQDLSDIKTISQIRPGEPISIRATLKQVENRRSPWRRMAITEALLADSTGSIVSVWFNQPFLKKVLREGNEYYFNGKGQIYSPRKGATGVLQLSNPTFELSKAETIHTAGIIPVYDLTEGLTQKQLRYWLKQSLKTLPQLPEHLPRELLEQIKLPALETAIGNVHFPKTLEELAEARKRLAFDELFLFQLALQSFKQKLKTFPAPRISFETALIKQFVSSLPFALTRSQRLAAWEILQDLEKPHPMNRLLEGEASSGKTVVAGLAMLQVGNQGWQSVLLAPTEILAWQHYETLEKLLDKTTLRLSLLTRSHKIGDPKAIASGESKIVIGTHALLQENVTFHKIGLLIVDEQHRFGVKQRGQLQNPQDEDLVPHLLSMTATPIPRTLALAFYGDLDISELRELPTGRKKIITRLVEPEKRLLAYEFIRKELKTGRQAYVITPLIEESDTLGVKAATQEAKKLKTESFPEFQIGLLHGKLKGEEKRQVMEDFHQGKINILVATSVVEVGVDVPNAAIMVIENAERFGLSQLHQLRGRVGRSSFQSYCLLFAESASEYTKARLEAVVSSNDGFLLAEKDLELRGPGEVIGLRQSGFIPFKIAKLSDKKLIKQAKLLAENLLADGGGLKRYPLLKQKVETIAKHAHLE